MKTYQTAYGQVEKVQLGGALPLQHWYERTQVAEQVHIKVKPLHCSLHNHYFYYCIAVVIITVVSIYILFKLG